VIIFKTELFAEILLIIFVGGTSIFKAQIMIQDFFH